MAPKPAKIIGCVLAAALFIMPAVSYPAELADTERLIRRITPPTAIVTEKPPVKDEWYVDGYFEPSSVIQGTRTGYWSELTTLYGYIHQNTRGYLSVSQYERFDDKDYTVNFGSYLSFKHSYVHTEVGFGWMTNYMYRFTSINEYGHKMYKNLYWQIGYTYKDYFLYDTHLVYPGLIYYFGDHYISADWGIGYMEDHDTGQFGIIKGNFAITKFLQWNLGVAFGDRLYDIYGLKAHKETGYILFTGLNMTIYKGFSGRIGYIYGEESPKFVKRSLYYALSAKF